MNSALALRCALLLLLLLVFLIAASVVQTDELVAKLVKKKERVVIDMCNVQASDRKTWMQSAMVEPKEAAIVFFDVATAACIERAAKRLGHPSGDLFQWFVGRFLVGCQGVNSSCLQGRRASN
jgi:hypothetical protein